MREAYEPQLPIRTDRLVLRALTEADAGALLAYRSLPEVCRWLPFAPMTAAQISARLAGSWRSFALTGNGTACTLGVEHDGVLVGDVMLVAGDETADVAELGWVFSPEHAGNGYATEAARELLRLAFDGLGVHRVIARMDPENDASAAVAMRLGMRAEALMIEDEQIDGVWLDTLYFALLEREYRAG